jgi:hypothetical protein
MSKLVVTPSEAGSPQALGHDTVAHHFGTVSYWQRTGSSKGTIGAVIRVQPRAVLTVAEAWELLRDLAGAVLAAEDDEAGRLDPEDG